MKPLKRRMEVAIVLPLSLSWGREVLQGILDFSSTNGNWQFYADSVNAPGARQIPNNWDGDGVIGRLNREDAETFESLHCPVVSVAGDQIGVQLNFSARVAADYRRGAEMVGNHFIERGLVEFGYLGSQFGGESYEGFEAAIRRVGGRCHVLGFDMADEVERADTRSLERRIDQWLGSLPRPIGIHAINDVLGRMIIQGCTRVGLDVPDDVAVVGCMNDDLMCEMTAPPLSSVQYDALRQGYEAAATLHRLMNDQPVSAKVTFIPPVRVIPRQSSDILAIDDTRVVRALRFIREHATHQPLSVEDVLAALGGSRRSLEYGFLKHLGRTPAAEIRRVRLGRVSHLLAHSSLPLDAVAASVGFNDQAYMTHVFKQHAGMTPRQYRLKHRPSQP